MGLAVLKAVAERETATGLVSVGDLIDATNIDPQVVVNELGRIVQGGYVTGELQKLMSGGDPRPWFLVNPLLTERGRALLDEQHSSEGAQSAAGSPQGLPRQSTRHWDAFISHAYEDKAGFVAELAAELTNRDLAVWYDDDVLEVGDSVRKAIDEGLQSSDFGVVVISPDFMQKDWPNRELDGILALERGQKRLLPIWHRVEYEDVKKYSPIVIGRKAVRSTIGVKAVADELCRSMKRGKEAAAPASPSIDSQPGPIFLSKSWANGKRSGVRVGGDRNGIRGERGFHGRSDRCLHLMAEVAAAPGENTTGQ